MNDFRDRFEAQLHSAATKLAGQTTKLPASLPRRRRQRRGPRRLALAAAMTGTLLVTAVALAATGAIQLGTAPSPAERLVQQVLASTVHAPACRMVGAARSTSSDQIPLSQITAMLPQLATPARTPSPTLLAAAAGSANAPVLASTIREAHFPGGIRLLMFVSEGQGPSTLSTPQACLRTRLAHLAAIRGRAHDPLRDAVAQEIRQLRDTSPGLQALTVDVLQRGNGASADGGGSSTPVALNSGPLPTGVLFSHASCPPITTGSACLPTIYAGIAPPGVTLVTVAPQRPHQLHGVRKQVPVDQGLFAFTLPPGTGPETITTRARTGDPAQTTPVPGL